MLCIVILFYYYLYVIFYENRRRDFFWFPTPTVRVRLYYTRVYIFLFVVQVRFFSAPVKSCIRAFMSPAVEQYYDVYTRKKIDKTKKNVCENTQSANQNKYRR